MLDNVAFIFVHYSIFISWFVEGVRILVAQVKFTKKGQKLHAQARGHFIAKMFIPIYTQALGPYTAKEKEEKR